MHSLTSALDGGEWSASRPGRFTPRERAPGTHWIRDWVGGFEARTSRIRIRIAYHSVLCSVVIGLRTSGVVSRNIFRVN
jgi:hypothetical protein